MASSNIIDEDLKKTVCLLVALTFPLSDWLKKKLHESAMSWMKQDLRCRNNPCPG
jgi:hypothetical protein